jgi:hypothetical protein
MEDENAECVADKISHSKFQKSHNGIVTEIKLLEDGDPISHLETSFKFVDVAFDIEYQELIGPNLVGLAYLEKFTTSTGDEFGLVQSSQYPFAQNDCAARNGRRDGGRLLQNNTLGSVW